MDTDINSHADETVMESYANKRRHFCLLGFDFQAFLLSSFRPTCFAAVVSERLLREIWDASPPVDTVSRLVQSAPTISRINRRCVGTSFDARTLLTVSQGAAVVACPAGAARRIGKVFMCN